MTARRPGPFTHSRLWAAVLASLLAACFLLLAPSGARAEATPEGKPPAAKIAPLVEDTTPLPASVTGGSAKSAGPSNVSAGGAIAKMVVGLAIVLAVIFGVYWLLKSTGRRRKAGTTDGRIEVVSSTPLAPGKTLHLVRVGDDIVLVGAAEHGVTPVRSWTGEDARRLDAQLTLPGRGMPNAGAGRIVDGLRRRTVRG